MAWMDISQKKFPFFYLVSIPMNAKSIVNWCYRVFQLDWTISKAPLCIIQNLLVHPVFYLETSTIIVTFLDHECFSLTVKGSRHAMAFLDFKDWTHVECNPTFLVQNYLMPCQDICQTFQTTSISLDIVLVSLSAIFFSGLLSCLPLTTNMVHLIM